MKEAGPHDVESDEPAQWVALRDEPVEPDADEGRADEAR